MTLYDEYNRKIGLIDLRRLVNDELREVFLLDGRHMCFGPGMVGQDDFGDYHILGRGPINPYYHYAGCPKEQLKSRDTVLFGMCRVSIRKVIFNDPATVVMWSDGTKTVVKCSPEDTYDMEKGLAMAIVKKMAGNDNRFHKVFKQYPKKKKKEPGSVGAITDMMAGLNQAAAIATETVHKLAHMAASKAERGE